MAQGFRAGLTDATLPHVMSHIPPFCTSAGRQVFEHERVSSELKKQIQQARLAKKLTQAQLAQVNMRRRLHRHAVPAHGLAACFKSCASCSAARK